MTTVKALNDDSLYTILSKCSSTIDMWHFLLALDYELPRMINLRAFWSHIRLSLSSYNKTILFSFVKEVAIYCVGLRLDNLNWMMATDLRRLLSHFRSLVYFHTGNVSLSKKTLINDIKILFPFLKYVTLLISLDSLTIPSSSSQQYFNADHALREICTSLNQINQLEHISLILQNKKGGCLSEQDARQYFRLVWEYISNMTSHYTLISIEENGYEIKKRFLLIDAVEEISFGSIHLSLISTLNHLIVSFRPMINVNLILDLKDSTRNILKLQTLVLPCIPSTSHPIDILDLNQLRILDIGYVNVKNPKELARIDEMLICHRRHSLRNLTLSLNEWQPARLVVVSKQQENREITTQFDSVFENCFDQITTPEEEDIEKPTFINTSPDLGKASPTVIEEFSLEFLDDTQSSMFQLSLNSFWLDKLTNLNLTGIHCHSIDFKHIFNSLHLLQSLSLSPCLLLYIDQLECSCQTTSPPLPYQIHSLKNNLLSLNLVSHIPDMKQSCPILLEQYNLHCIRHSSIHQLLNKNEISSQYENLTRSCIRAILQTLDVHHLSIRIPNYEFQTDDFDIQSNNHLQSLVLDVRIPMTFHTKLTSLYSKNILDNLRRFILINNNHHFQLTPLLIDKFRTLEIIEIISMNYRLNRSTINYLESVLKPSNYPNLNIFRVWIGSVDANHLLKRLHKTIRLAFESIRPAFQFDISIINPSSKLIQTRKCILYDNTHEIHQYFHSLLSIHSNQLSIIYPNFLNYKPLYSEHKFDK